MENSIESMWKKGFLENDAFIVPKINDLYNKKSVDIVEKMTRMFRVNLIVILVFAVVLFVGSALMGIPWIGGAMFVLWSGLVWVGTKQMDKLVELDRGVSNYEYLKAFDNWRKQVVALFTRVYRVFYPTMFLVFGIGIWYSTLGDHLLKKILEMNPDVMVLWGIPVFWWITVAIGATLMSLFAGKIYEWDLKIVYGRAFKRLDEILRDMEELNGESL